MSSRLYKKLALLIVLFLVGISCIYLVRHRSCVERSWLVYISHQLSANQHPKKNVFLHEKVIHISNDIKDDENYKLYIENIYENVGDSRKVKVEDYEKVEDSQYYRKDWKYLKELKKMLKDNDRSRDIEFEEDFLRSYLINTNYDIDIAFSKMLNFLQLREEHAYFFRNISFDFTQNQFYNFIYKLPHRLEDGSVVVLFQFGKWEPDLVPFKHLKQMMFMMHIQEVRNPVSQVSGFHLIYDFKDAGFKHLKYGTPSTLHLLHYISFEAAPVKFLSFHIVNINAIGRIFVTLSRPFLPKYVEEIFYTHSSVKDLLDYYPGSILPVEYGGNLTDCYPEDWIRNANKEHGNFPAGGLKNIL